MDIDEVDRLLDIDTHDSLALRDRVMLEVIYGAGLRLAELVGLNCADVNLGGAKFGWWIKAIKSENCPSVCHRFGLVDVLAGVRDQYTPQNDTVFIAQCWRHIFVRNV